MWSLADVMGRPSAAVFLLYAALTLIAGGGLGVVGIQLVNEDMEVVTVENGTAEAVVLDCPYEVEEGDKLEDIDIKWYFEEAVVPFYQWIPSDPHPPQTIEKFREQVDTSYRVEVEGDGAAHIHRAIRLLNPTTELTGDYFCRISSFLNHKLGKRKLVVYTKPEVMVWTDKVEVEGEGGQKENGVEVKCEVEGMYPQPALSISHILSEGGERHELTKVDVTTTAGEGLYSAHAEGRVSDAALDGTTVFWCNVTVSDTDLNFSNNTKYQPSTEIIVGAVQSGADAVNFLMAPLLALTLLVLRCL